MELRIEPYTAPERIVFNYEELKKMLLEKAEHYETMVYTEDQVKMAKADRANLNKLKKALNDERIRREKEYMESFNEFKGQIAEIIRIIEKPLSSIDNQVKGFEERQREEKRETIKAAWAEYLAADKIPAGITFDHLFNEKWLNASVSFKSIQDEMNARIEQIEKDLFVIENLPSYAYEAREVYINTLDLGKAVSEAQRLQEIAERKAAREVELAKQREQEEAERARISPAVPEKNAPETAESEPHTNIPPNPETPRTWVNFAALITREDALALKEFFLSRNITFKAI